MLTGLNATINSFEKKINHIGCNAKMINEPKWNYLEKKKIFQCSVQIRNTLKITNINL